MRAYVDEPASETVRASGVLVVVVPGLGLPQYVFPTAERLVARGHSCAVLDLPGFGSRGGLSCPPDVHAVGRTAAGWVRAQGVTGPVVLLGHSTGSQAALAAALELQRSTPLALLLAGPTFTPAQRRLPRLAAAIPLAYREDSPAELVVMPTALRNVGALWSLLRSGMRDVPERTIRELRVPLALTAGRADAFAPEDWLSRLAASADPAASPTVRVLPGSHNNPFTHPEELAGLVTELAGQVDGRPPSM